MSDHDDRTCDGSRESRGGEGSPIAIVVEERELRRFAKLEKPLLRAAVKLAFKKDPRKMQLSERCLPTDVIKQMIDI